MSAEQIAEWFKSMGGGVLVIFAILAIAYIVVALKRSGKKHGEDSKSNPAGEAGSAGKG